MDATAVGHASDQELMDMGIKSKGDVLSLRSYAKSKQTSVHEETRTVKKKTLLEILKRKKGKAIKPPSQPSYRKIKLG